MQIFNFVVLFVIITAQNVLTSHISKTHLPIVSLNVRELEFWTDAQKTEVPLYVRNESPLRHPRPLPLSLNTY